VSELADDMTIGATAPLSATRPFYWSVRRELWENRAIYIGPIAAVAVVLLGFALTTFSLPLTVRAAVTNPAAAQSLHIPYSIAAAAAAGIGFVVEVFYCLGALQGERRDRSLLFWKSLPVSDRTTVLAKAAIPLIVQPIVIVAAVLAAQAIMLVWSTIVLMVNGIDPGLLWTHLNLLSMWVMLPYGQLLNALWEVPLVGWLLLVSAWAPRMTFVWAIAPPLGLCLFEFMAVRTHHIADLLGSRLFAGHAQIASMGGAGGGTFNSLGEADPLHFFASPGLWGGLVVGAAMLAACVWLRRRASPL
jgi:ABC-2 type transport system permease protein